MIRILALLCLIPGLRAQTSTVPWSGFAHDPQHTGLSTIGAQRLETVKWTTPVDLVLQGASGPLYIHYGSPLATAANTMLVPVRTTSANTYQVEAHRGADGTLLYTLPTDFTPPPYDWIPAYGPALSQGTRLYYPGAGGTVYYRDQPDSATGPSGQIAFYGNSLYAANQAAFAATVMISTPITADAAGNIYFGFDVTGSNPASLTSGLARIGADGTGSWISASAAAGGDPAIVEVAMNCAPALSNDGTTLYFAVSDGPLGTNTSAGGYLVSVNSPTLAPIAQIRLKDPKSGADAVVTDSSSSSPTVGPDGDVYYGVLESAIDENDGRGWLLHFDTTLTITKTPGEFGWDTTASVVPHNLVASYAGTSSYLLFTKYNDYVGHGSGTGQNKIAVLDPNATMTDAVTQTPVMQEVLTILGPTPDAAGGVREWCINSAAIDPFAASAIANSEDGTLYRWDFASNSFIQKVALTSGVAESYTPTAIGADGTAYAINDANLFAVAQGSNLTILSSHSGSFSAGQIGAAYTLNVTNSGSAATNGNAVVTDTLPPSITATSIGGTGWTCTQPAGPCTQSNVLQAGFSYSAITLTVNVAADAPSPSTVINVASVSSDGAVNSVNSTDSDLTAIGNLPPPVLSIVKMHSGNFTQGQVNAVYTVTVSNASGAGPTNGTVTVTETVPTGLTLVSMAGTGWSCPAGGNTCTRSDNIAAGASFPSITVMVNVADNASSPQVNTVTLAGGGSAPANTTDTTGILPIEAPVTIQTVPPGLEFSVDGGTLQFAPQTVYLSPGAHTLAVASLQSPATPGTLDVFTSWSDGGSASHSITVAGTTAATYTATFQTQYSLTISASPAADGVVSPATGIFYDAGTVVTITAAANAGFVFNGWAGAVASASSAITTVTMNTALTVTANFVRSSGITISGCSATSFNYTLLQAAVIPANIVCNVSDDSATVGIKNLTVSGVPSSWLSAVLGATSLVPGTPTTLTLTPVNLSTQSAGTLGPPTIVVSGTPVTGGGTASGTLNTITLTIAPAPAIMTSPTSLVFDAPTQSTAVIQTLSVTDTPTVAMAVTATPTITTPAGGSWLGATSGTTPFTSTVTAFGAGLGAGTFLGSLEYSAPGAAADVNLPVVLNVGQLAVSGGPVTFTYSPGSTPAPMVVNVSAGVAAVNWVASAPVPSAGTANCNWLIPGAASGTTPRGGSSTVSIGYNPALLPNQNVATYQCIVTYSAAAGYGAAAVTANTVPVTIILVVQPLPVLSIAPSTSLTFNLPTLAGAATASVAVSAASGSTSAAVPFTAAPVVITPSGGTWLAATGGTTTASGPPAISTVTVTDGGLAQGTYGGSIAYASSGASGNPNLPVVLNVGTLAVSGGPVNFTYQFGVTTPGTATLSVSAGPAAINWVAAAPIPSGSTANCNWLIPGAASGATPSGGSNTVSVSYNPSALPVGPGNYSCVISYSPAPGYGASGADAVPLTVTLVTLAGPLFVVAPASSQNVSVLVGATTAPGTTFQISANSLLSPATAIAATLTPFSDNPLGTGPGPTPIFTASTTNLTVPASPGSVALTINANPAGLPMGTYQGSFTISSPEVTTSTVVTVNLVVAPPQPCGFTVSASGTVPLTNAVPVDGTTPVTVAGSFTVTPGPTCTAANTWTASSGSPWLVITSGGSGNGGSVTTVTLNALSNPTSSGRTGAITITPSGLTPAIVQLGQPGSTAPLLDREVTALYQSVLGRDPDPQGYTFWTGSGAAGLGQMVDSFLTSPEAFNSDFAVMAVYQAATGAPPDYAEFTAAVSSVRLGTQTVPGLFNSLIAVNPSYSAGTLYQNLLSRATTAADNACIGTGLAACFQTIIGYPATVTPADATNNEFQSTGTFANLTSTAGDHTNNLYITMLYFVILDRDPDAGGLAYWLGIANNGGAGLLFQGETGYPTRIQVLGTGVANQGFIGSQEFLLKFE